MPTIDLLWPGSRSCCWPTSTGRRQARAGDEPQAGGRSAGSAGSRSRSPGADDCIGETARQRSTPCPPAASPCSKTSAITRARSDDPVFAAELAKLGDIYVNDAFSAAHRTSTEGVAKLPAYPGLSMERELHALNAALGNPERPVIGIVGGSSLDQAGPAQEPRDQARQAGHRRRHGEHVPLCPGP
ncbi:MAG: phosphoglycerate kinase [Hyphomonadaceae bacterium]